MPDLNFSVDRAQPVLHAASPALAFTLRIRETRPEQAESRTIPAVALRCQIRIEPTQRNYAASEQERLLDLFGEPSRWGQTLRSMLWTHVNVVVPPFSGDTTVELPVPCTFDFNVAATKYFHALEGGELPLCVLFSGTIFHTNHDGLLQISQIPWEKEARFRLPAQTWKELMAHYYPNGSYLFLQRDVFDRLYLYKTRLGLPSWERAIGRLLDVSEERMKS